MADYADLLSVYRRIGKAAREGRGVRLSAEEVAVMWHLDTAISGAVDTDDEEESDRRAAPTEER